jgi:hypothetical protein
LLALLLLQLKIVVEAAVAAPIAVSSEVEV